MSFIKQQKVGEDLQSEHFPVYTILSLGSSIERRNCKTMEPKFKTDNCDKWFRFKKKVDHKFAENNEQYKTDILETNEKCFIESAYEIITQCKMSIKSKLHSWWVEKNKKATKKQQKSRRKRKKTRTNTDKI